MFSQDGKLPAVPPNVRLVPGLFADTLPGWLKERDAEAGGRMPNITYMHVSL